MVTMGRRPRFLGTQRTVGGFCQLPGLLAHCWMLLLDATAGCCCRMLLLLVKHWMRDPCTFMLPSCRKASATSLRKHLLT